MPKNEKLILNLTETFFLESFGVRVAVGSNQRNVLLKIKSRISEILPIKWCEIKSCATKKHFSFIKHSKTGKYSLYESENLLAANVSFPKGFEIISSGIRLTVAEFSARKVFLHAGVIGLKDFAILIPGKSFAGKTTLVAEFSGQGYEYFSDEYALLDKKGLVYPFPKKLSMRGIIDEYSQLDLDVGRFGGVPALKPLPVRFILLTEFRKHDPVRITEAGTGEGFMACIANSISIRQNPRKVFEVLNSVTKNSRILKGTRGEAREFVKEFSSYINNSGKNKANSSDD